MNKKTVSFQITVRYLAFFIGDLAILYILHLCTLHYLELIKIFKINTYI